MRVSVQDDKKRTKVSLMRVAALALALFLIQSFSKLRALYLSLCDY